MGEERFFYKYQSLKPELDKSKKERVYEIENLANNQLHFKYPHQFNDPFDSRIYCYYLGTEEQFIDLVMEIHDCEREEALEAIKEYIDMEIYERREDGLIYTDFTKVYKEDSFHGDIKNLNTQKFAVSAMTRKIS